MNAVWVNIVILSLGFLLFKNVDVAFSSILSGSQKAVSLSLKLWAIYAVWLGILKIVEDTNLDKKLGKLLSPLINKLIGKTDAETHNQIAINLSSNMLGMGNASTPSGIKAMQGLDRGQELITSSMMMFFILNTTSLQILPTTVIGLRMAAGSKSPNDIIFPTLFASLVSTISGICLLKICHFIKKTVQAKQKTKTNRIKKVNH